LSVTDTKCVAGETFDSRNGEASVGGVTDMKPDTGDAFDTRNGDNGSVTDANSGTDALNNFRNPDSLEDAAASINALARFPMSEAERNIRGLAYRAQRTCDFCGVCGRRLDKGETIWRVSFGLGPCIIGWSWTMAPTCEQCRPWNRGYLPETPCEHCGRRVVNQAGGRQWYRKHTYCSERCADENDSIIQKSVRAQRRQQREYICSVCEKAFRPSRKDALHCSSACRQRDYRNRQRNKGER